MMKPRQRAHGPFTSRLRRIPSKGGWTYVLVPKKLTPPVTRAWGRTPVEATVDKAVWSTSIWRTKAGQGFLPVPKRVRGTKEAGARVTVAFEFVDD
jgi:Domain of unknown function (DUF1905)